jgi:hypothetical protein
MKQYQIGDMMEVPFNGVSTSVKILHIPQHPSQMWLFKHPTLENKAFGIATNSPITQYTEQSNI